MIIQVTREYDIDMAEVFSQFAGDTRQMMDDNMDEQDIVMALIAEYGFDEVVGYTEPDYEAMEVI